MKCSMCLCVCNALTLWVECLPPSPSDPSREDPVGHIRLSQLCKHTSVSSPLARSSRVLSSLPRCLGD